MRALVAASLISAFAVSGSDALAEPFPYGSDPRYFAVTFEPTTPNAQVEVERVSEHAVVGTCTGTCSLPIGPGRYMIKVTEESGKASKEAVTIIEPQRLVLQPPDRDAKYVGLAVGIAGTSMATFGCVYLLFCNQYSCDSQDRYPYLFPAVATLTVAGFIAAPIGWAIFGKNRKLHILPSPHGATISAGFTF